MPESWLPGSIGSDKGLDWSPGQCGVSSLLARSNPSRAGARLPLRRTEKMIAHCPLMDRQPRGDRKSVEPRSSNPGINQTCAQVRPEPPAPRFHPPFPPCAFGLRHDGAYQQACLALSGISIWRGRCAIESCILVPRDQLDNNILGHREPTEQGREEGTLDL